MTDRLNEAFRALDEIGPAPCKCGHSYAEHDMVGLDPTEACDDLGCDCVEYEADIVMSGDELEELKERPHRSKGRK
jgi:hypothetical protein